MKKFALDFMVLHVGQMCNLRCKDCCNFVPYAPPESRRYPVEKIISDLETVFTVVGRIDRLQIQGGEPLIYSDLAKLLGYLGACREIVNIWIATNGMKVPDDELLHICSINNVAIRISDYPQNRGNLEAFVLKARAHRVTVNIYEFSTEESLWQDLGNINEVTRTVDNQIVQERFKNCEFRGCLTLADGEFHRCGRGVNASKVLGFKPAPGDLVEVRDNPNFRNDFITYVAYPQFETACRYCNGTLGSKKIPAAQQL